MSAVAIGGYRQLAPAGRGRALAAAVPILLTVAVLTTVPPTIVTHPDVADGLVYAF